MIDFIKAKRAIGGVSKSYYAFAYTHGDVILLGMERPTNKSLRAADLPLWTVRSRNAGIS